MKTLDLDAGALRQAAPHCAMHLVRLQLQTVLIATLPLLAGSAETVRGKALHDFRVALRRLRSTLRGWEERLPGVLSDKQARRLKKLSRRAGEVRDLELRIEALQQRRGAHEEAPLAALLDQLDVERRQRQRKFRQRLHRLGKAAAKLQARLAAEPAAGDETAAAALGRLTLAHWRALQEALDITLQPEAMRPPHRARIAAKRLRYLLEPLRRHYGSADAAVEQLIALQDGLGELHDRQLLRQALRHAADGGTQFDLLCRELEREIRSSLGAARRLLRQASRRRLARTLEALLEDLGAAA